MIVPPVIVVPVMFVAVALVNRALVPVTVVPVIFVAVILVIVPVTEFTVFTNNVLHLLSVTPKSLVVPEGLISLEPQ